MQVYLKFAIGPPPASPEPWIIRWLLKIPERWANPFVQVYTNVFAYGLVGYAAAWAFVMQIAIPHGAQFSRNALFFAATGWLPFLALYLVCISWIVARLHRSVEFQKEALESLESDLGDVIGEAVSMTLNRIQGIGPADDPDTDLDKYFRKH